MTADEIRALLKLEPYSTCGFVRVTFISEKWIAAGGLPPPFAEGRPAGSALYFMVTPDAPARVHRIRNDQLYHYYLGDPIEVLMLRENRTRGSRVRSAWRPMCATANPRKYFSHGARSRAAPLVSGRKHRMAGRGTG